MSKKTKGLLYNFIGFAIIFFSIRYGLTHFFGLEGLTRSLIAFGIGTLLAPKFQTVNTKEGEKLFMKWIFVKGIKEVE
ncbi:hypothetical protein [Flavobacterium sp.]|uniref:hypothetical protein n=1 Tax=Flavobacterium sp. TaxID=239 RepID=UPI003D0BA255